MGSRITYLTGMYWGLSLLLVLCFDSTKPFINIKLQLSFLAWSGNVNLQDVTFWCFFGARRCGNASCVQGLWKMGGDLRLPRRADSWVQFLICRRCCVPQMRCCVFSPTWIKPRSADRLLPSSWELVGQLSLLEYKWQSLALGSRKLMDEIQGAFKEGFGFPWKCYFWMLWIQRTILACWGEPSTGSAQLSPDVGFLQGSVWRGWAVVIISELRRGRCRELGLLALCCL